MLYLVEENEEKMTLASNEWKLKELKLEKLLINKSEDGKASILSFGFKDDDLLVIDNQLKTSAGKILDILALDRFGNGVIVELKKDTAKLGVETQALQYLAAYSWLNGQDFIDRFKSKVSEDTIMGFLGGKIKKENINKNTSILLVAREFDSTLFSMGEWLSSKGVAFKCVEFKPIQYDEHKFLSFSVIFDKTPQSNYSVAFSNPSKPGIYWFNIGVSEESKWETLKEKQIIIAGFEHKPGDRGDKLLNSFIDKDRIVAYSSRNGAVGYGIIDKDKKEIYSLTDAGDGLGTLHRLNIRWIAKANRLEEGISSKDIKKNFGIYHPVQTSSAIDDEKGEKLIKAIEEKFHPRG